MQRPAGGENGSTGAQERSVLHDCAMECYVPARPLAVADLDAFFTADPSTRPPTRRYVVQGEQLQLYLLVRPSVDASAGDLMKASSLSQLSVKVHFAEASAMKGILMMEKKKPRIMDDHPHINAVVSDPVAPYLTVLSNGSYLYAVQASMAVKDEYCNKLFHIVVTVALPTKSESADLPADATNIRSILRATAVVDRSPSRTLVLEVELQQPLTVSFTRVVASSRTIVRIAAENKHSTLPLWLYDLQFLKDYTKMAREAGGSPVISHAHKLSDSRLVVSSSELDSNRLPITSQRDRKIQNLNFKEYFNIILEAETFPIKLAPGDEYCFIASIEPLPGAYAKFFALKSRNFDSNVLLTWGMGAPQGRMLSSYDLHWSAPECREFLLSVSCKSPVLRNSVFPVSFTVTNLSSETQDLVITIAHDHDIELDMRIGEQEAATLVRRLADSSNAVMLREMSSDMVDASHVGKRSILCFQHAVELGPVKAASSVSVNVQYVALRDGVAQISELQIVDKISRRIFKTREVCEVYVMSPDDWREHEAARAAATSPAKPVSPSTTVTSPTPAALTSLPVVVAKV